MSTFCQRSYHRTCQRRKVGGQKSQNLVNVVCEQPLSKKSVILNLIFFCVSKFEKMGKWFVEG